MHRKVQMRILGIALLAIGIALVPACKKDADRNDPKPTIVGSDNGRQADDSADSVGETAADSNAQSDAQAKESNGVRPIEKSAEEHQIRIKSWQEPPRKAKFSPIPAQSNLGDNHLLDEVPDSSFFVIAAGGAFPLDDRGFVDFFHHISVRVLATLNRHATSNDSKPDPLNTAIDALLRGMFKSFSPQKLASLGISEMKVPAFVFYFEQNTPVLKIQLSDAEKFKSVVDSYMNMHHVKSETMSLGFDNVWILYKHQHGETRLAVNWGATGTMTATFVANKLQAETLLRKTKERPEKGRSARSQIVRAQLRDDRNVDREDIPHDAVVALWDIGKFRNAFVALESQWDALFGRQRRIDRICSKEFNRITKNIHTVLVSTEPVSNKKTIALQSNIRLSISPQWNLRDLFDNEPYERDLPLRERYPLVQASLSIPLGVLFAKYREISNDIRRDEFKCEYFTFLNEIAETDVFPSSFEERVLPDIAEDAYSLGAVLFTGHEQRQTTYAGYFSAPNAAHNAQDMGVIDIGGDGALRHDGDDDDDDTDAIVAYGDASLTADLGALSTASKPRLLAQTDLVAIATDDDMNDAMKKSTLKEGALLFRMGWSERMAKYSSLVVSDDDIDRNYHIDWAAVYDPELLELGGVDLIWVYGIE